MKRNIIFLDIDGTLLPFNQDKAHLYRSLKILNAIIAANDAKIVFSSDWRRHSDGPKALLAELYMEVAGCLFRHLRQKTEMPHTTHRRICTATSN